MITVLAAVGHLPPSDESTLSKVEMIVLPSIRSYFAANLCLCLTK